MLAHVSKGLKEKYEAHRDIKSPSFNQPGDGGLHVVPDSEISVRGERRRFTAEYKCRILQEAETCKKNGMVGVLLHREGLYASNLSSWRRQLERGRLETCSPRKRGPKEKVADQTLYQIGKFNNVSQTLERSLTEHNLTGQILSARSQQISHTDMATRALLRQHEQEIRDIEKKLLSNIKGLVVPYVKELRKFKLGQKQSSLLDIIDANLKLVIKPFLQNLAAQYSCLTPREIQIASLAKCGKRSSEIADLLNVRLCSVNFHRKNIRKKLGLKGKNSNLHSFLITLSE